MHCVYVIPRFTVNHHEIDIKSFYLRIYIVLVHIYNLYALDTAPHMYIFFWVLHRFPKCIFTYGESCAVYHVACKIHVDKDFKYVNRLFQTFYVFLKSISVSISPMYNKLLWKMKSFYSFFLLKIQF